MKYIFTIHSPITYLASLAVIDLEKISEKDVVLIESIDIPIDSRFECLSFKRLESNIITKIIKPNLTNSIDKIVNDLVGSSRFIAYIDLFTIRNRILITHPRCKSFHVIEEGMQTYMDYDTLDYLTHDIRIQKYRNSGILDFLRSLSRAFIDIIRGYKKRLIALPYALRNYSGIKGINYYVFDVENALPGVPREKLKQICFTSLRSSSSKIDISDSVVFIEDSLAETFYNDNTLYFNALIAHESTIFNLIRGKNVFIKLRPKQKISESSAVKYLENKNIEFIILPQETILELVLKDSMTVTLIGVVSALLYYGSLMGHKSYSVFSSYPTTPKTPYHNNLSAFWKKVEQISR